MLCPPLPSDNHALSILPGTLQKHSAGSLPCLHPQGVLESWGPDEGRGTCLFQIKPESP